MRTRVKQAGFAAGLLAPLVWTALTFTPPAAPAYAQAANRLLGPNFPILVDTNRDGHPTEGVDTPITITRTGSSVRVDTPWDCNRRDSTEMFTISEVDSSGRFRAGSRTGAVSGTMQLVRFNSFNSAGFPLGVQYVETSQSGATLATGTGTFVDANGDGLYDAGREPAHAGAGLRA